MGTKQERGQQAMNKTNERQYSHAGKQKQSDKKVKRQKIEQMRYALTSWHAETEQEREVSRQ